MASRALTFLVHQDRYGALHDSVRACDKWELRTSFIQQQGYTKLHCTTHALSPHPTHTLTEQAITTAIISISK